MKKKQTSRFVKKKAEFQERFDRILKKMPWRKSKRPASKGPCDAEIQVAEEKLNAAVQALLDYEDALDEALVAMMARDICLNG